HSTHAVPLKIHGTRRLTVRAAPLMFHVAPGPRSHSSVKPSPTVKDHVHPAPNVNDHSSPAPNVHVHAGQPASTVKAAGQHGMAQGSTHGMGSGSGHQEHRLPSLDAHSSC